MGEPEQEKSSNETLRTIVKIGWIPVLLVLCYSGWLLYSRQRQSQELEEAAKVGRVQQDREILRQLGSGQLKILAFYASPPNVKRGERTLLCYGVAGAKSVRIEPGIEPIAPSLSRCVEARPVKETKYTLTAEDEHGALAKQEITVNVER